MFQEFKELVNKRFEQIDKTFEQVDRRFKRLTAFLWIVVGIFTAMTIILLVLLLFGIGEV